MNEVEEAFNKEMEKLERQQRDLRDKYNTMEPSQDEHDYKRIINADSTLDYAIHKSETLKQYLPRLQVYTALAHKKNWKIHVIIGSSGRPWYTHKRPEGCFMCEDTNLISYMLNLLQAISQKSPSLTLV